MRNFLLLFLIFTIPFALRSQVLMVPNVDSRGSTPEESMDPSAILQVQGVSADKGKGFLMSKYADSSTMARASGLPQGLIIRLTGHVSQRELDGSYYYYDGTSWKLLKLNDDTYTPIVPDGALDSTHLVDDDIRATTIAAGAIDSSHIQDGSLRSSSFVVSGAIDTRSFKPASIDVDGKYAPGVVAQGYVPYWNKSAKIWDVRTSFGGLTYLGEWDAAANNPVLIGTSTKRSGSYYLVRGSGTLSGVTYNEGDWILVGSSKSWVRVPSGVPVISVYGRGGNIIAQASDYSIDQLLLSVGKLKGSSLEDIGDTDLKGRSVAEGEMLSYDNISKKWISRTDIGTAALPVDSSGIAPLSVEGPQIAPSAIDAVKIGSLSFTEEHLLGNLDTSRLAIGSVQGIDFEKLTGLDRVDGFLSYDAVTSKWKSVNLGTDLVFVGLWDAKNNIPPLNDADVVTLGSFYAVSENGTKNLGSGVVNYAVGDMLIKTGTGWVRVEQTSDVTSFLVSGTKRKGVVVAQAGDYTWDMVPLTNSKLSDLGDASFVESSLRVGHTLLGSTISSDWKQGYDLGHDFNPVPDSASFSSDVVSIASLKNASIDFSVGVIPNATLDSTQFAPGSIISANIKDGALSGSNFAPGQLHGSVLSGLGTGQIKDLEIDSSLILDGSITSIKVKINSVDSFAIADLAISTASILANTIDSFILADGEIDSLIIGPILTELKIRDTSIVGLNIEEDVFTVANVANYITGLSVTNDKLLDTTLITRNFSTGAIANTHIHDSAVLGSHIASGQLTANHIVVDAVESQHLMDSAVTSAKLVDDKITTAKIKDLSIVSSNFKADGILLGNDNTPHVKAALHIVAPTDKGILYPRMTQAQIATLKTSLVSADKGLSVYSTTDSSLYVWNGTDWDFRFAKNSGDTDYAPYVHADSTYTGFQENASPLKVHRIVSLNIRGCFGWIEI